MMPGIGFEEMLVLVVVAIIVIGPKDLPLMMRKFGRFTGKMRAMAFDFKQGLDELGRQAELDELRKEVANLKKHTGMDELKKEFEEDEINLRKDIDSAMAPVELPKATHPAIASNGNGNGEHHEGVNGDAANGEAVNGEAGPAVAPYAGLSPDHPGYDTGDDFRIDGSSPEPEPVPATPPIPAPLKQDTPA
jgi:sec-independent protein translocase protein TatB